MPKIILGTYVLFLAFAAWHIHFVEWSVPLIVVGIVLTIMGALENNQN